MAVNTRTAAPSYKIYEPDALDVALSNKVLDPLQGGIAGAMLLNHQAESANNVRDFTADQSRFNKMAAGLDAMEIAQKSQEARMKLAPGLMEHGTNAKDILGIEDVLSPSGIQSNDAASLFGDKTRAEIAAALAKASHAGDGTKETTTETSMDAGTGKVVAHKYGGPPVTAIAPVDATGSTPIPDNNPNKAIANRQAAVKAGIAAVGGTGPQDVAGGTDAEGNLHIVNKADPTRKVVIDKNGKQIR